MGRRFHLKLPGSTDYLDLIREFVSKLATQAGFDEENVYKIVLAVDEACTNVVRHAYSRANTHFVDVEAEVNDVRLTIIVSDSGRGFDPGSITAPDIEDIMARHRGGGFGLYLIKTLMDEVDFSIDPGVRNAVRMTKYLKKG